MIPSDRPRLGKYELIDVIGRGSMGTVYLAHDPYINRHVAIKVLTASQLDDEEGRRYRKLFFNEAQTAGSLKHPNILAVYDAGIEGDTCYLVTELIEGGKTLKAHCRKENLLPLDTALEIVFKCAKALDYAHKQGVTHRDIKPSNILLMADNEVKIADFSVAFRASTESTVTKATAFVGSPRYMSPEQIHEEPITPQADLFSLGIVMYEMLTGEHPFVADTFPKLINKIAHEIPPSLRELCPEIPSAVEKITLRALEKDKRERYRSGLDLAHDLAVLYKHLNQPQVDISAKEKFFVLRDLEFFTEFSQSELWEIINGGLWQELGPSAGVISEGEIEDCFYVLVNGEVVVKNGATPIGRLKKGDCFGEMGYLSKERRTASIAADGPISLIGINSTSIQRLSTECQLRFYKVFLGTLIKRLSLTAKKTVQPP
ncbi:MAG: protein kinase domain-containing protein [Gammaproteobacteria bacterium]